MKIKFPAPFSHADINDGHEKRAVGLCADVTSLVARADVPTGQPEQIRASLDRLLQEPYTEIGNRAYNLFDKLTLAETIQVRSILLATKSSPYREAALLGLIQHWAKLDGPAAYEYARSQENVSKMQAMQDVFYGWASSQPTEAWDELMIVSNRGADRRFNLMAPLT